MNKEQGNLKGSASTMPVTQAKSYKNESELKDDILKTFGALSFMRIWRVNTGVAYGFGQVRGAMGLLRGGNVQAGIEAMKHLVPTTYGVPGQADMQGLINGRFLAIEAKMPKGVWEEEQQNWGAMVKKFGGIYILAYSLLDVELALRGEGYN